jgi:t-SNARE complex subunit (syntaxin)
MALPELFEQFASIISVTAGAAVTSFLWELFRSSRTSGKRKGLTLQQRTERLSRSLSEAVQLIDQMEGEIAKRQSMVSKLEKDIELSQKIAKARKSEMEAAAKLLRVELQREERHAFWQNVLLNVVFFVLGAVFTYFIRVL